MGPPPVIAIIGAGFCGALASMLLLGGELPAGSRVVLLERPRRRIGGVAYDPPSERLLLNVPAERMSAFVDTPGDFVDFLRAAAPAHAPGDFVPRRLYGRYLEDRLERAAARAAARVRFERRELDVLDVAHAAARWELRGVTGGHPVAMRADAALLATGGGAPVAPAWLEPAMRDSGLYSEAWAGERRALPADGELLVIGTGLSFVDMLLEVRAGGFRGRVTAVSRHGRLPHVERGPAPPPEPSDAPPAFGARANVREATRAVRRHARQLAQRDRDYRTLIAALRPQIADLWSRLPDAERARFVRHGRSLWDVHRHRMPTVVAARVHAELADGSLRVVAGRVTAVEHLAGALHVTLRRRGTEEHERLHVQHVINCTGAAAGAPLAAPWPVLVDRGHAQRDGMGLGVLTDAAGRLLGRHGAAERLYYAGPLWRAQHWEMTAVPELRARLPAVAAAITADVVGHRDLA